MFTGPPGAAWEDNLRAVGAATGRLDAANGLIDGFEQAADKTGADNDATHFQASVVQFTDTTMRVYGADNFPGSVLAAVGVDRPAAQRFTDKPYVEIGTTDTDMENSPDFSAADGDIVYISFASPAAKDRAPQILGSDAWKKLSANRDNRVFAVNNEVWQTGEGIVAARGMLADLKMGQRPDQLVVVGVFHVLKSTYVQSPDVVEQTRPAHLEFLKAEIDAGRLLLAGRQEDGSGGMLDHRRHEPRGRAGHRRPRPLHPRRSGPLRAVVVQRRLPRPRL